MAKNLIFNIQDLSMQDGPGIRTTIFFKGCPLRCRWCCNPEGQEAFVELMHFRSLCKRCLSCQKTCGRKAVGKDREGFPSFNRSTCRDCTSMACIDSCSGQALRPSGRSVEPDEVVCQIKANAAFYRNSGGGITLSGGEPLMQPELARALVAACRLGGIGSIGVETSGCFAWEELQDFIGDFDFYYFDVKCLDRRQHQQQTGKDNQLILDNLRRLAGLGAERIIISIAVIPGFNNNMEFMADVVALCRQNGISRVRLLAYHGLGAEKHVALGRKYALAEDAALAPGFIESCRDFFIGRSLDCSIE